MDNFNIQRYLEKERTEALSQANGLLWANLEDRNWRGGSPAVSREEECRRKLSFQFDNFHPVLVKFQLGLSGTITHMLPSKTQEILQYGASRRIGSIYRATNEICRIAYLDRTEPLTADDATNLSDNLLLIYVHMIGVVDAFAIAFHRVSNPPIKVDEKKADLLNKQFRRKIGIEPLNQVLLENESWLTRIKNDYRNRYVHRVPPYIPTSTFTGTEQKRHTLLEQEKYAEISKSNFARVDQIGIEQSQLGTFQPWICFSDTDEVVHLHPTLLEDLMRFQVLVMAIFEILLPNLDFDWA